MEKLALLIKNYAWSSVDSCSDYKYIKHLDKLHFKVVMYSFKLFTGYPPPPPITTNARGTSKNSFFGLHPKGFI